MTPRNLYASTSEGEFLQPSPSCVVAFPEYMGVDRRYHLQMCVLSESCATERVPNQMKSRGPARPATGKNYVRHALLHSSYEFSVRKGHFSPL